MKVTDNDCLKCHMERAILTIAISRAVVPTIRVGIGQSRWICRVLILCVILCPVVLIVLKELVPMAIEPAEHRQSEHIDHTFLSESAARCPGDGIEHLESFRIHPPAESVVLSHLVPLIEPSKSFKLLRAEEHKPTNGERLSPANRPLNEVKEAVDPSPPPLKGGESHSDQIIAI